MFVRSEAFWPHLSRRMGGMSPNENRKYEQNPSHKIIKFRMVQQMLHRRMTKNPLAEFVALIENREDVVEDVSVKASGAVEVDADPEIV